MSSGNTNSNLSKGVGTASQPFLGAGVTVQPVHLKPQPHLITQSQSQTTGGSAFPGHFQLSEPQAQVLGPGQYVPVHPPQAQAQAAPAAFRAQLQGQGQSVGQNAGTGTTALSSPASSISGAGSTKRPQQKPPSRPTGSSASNTASPLKTMELAPTPQRKKPRIPDNQIPARVAALVPESALYSHFLELESRIDAALARKKSDIQESLKNPPTVQKTLRVYIFNTFSNREQTNPGEISTEPPSWTLKIFGRILENEVDTEAAGMACKEVSRHPKFSTFFKKIAIYLDQGLYPNNHVIFWDSARSPGPCEGFEVKRKGDKEFTVMVRFEMNYVPEKFKLSPALLEVLGFEADTRARIIAALWHYIKVKRLQNPNDPSFFACDPPLRKVFGEEKIRFSMVPQKISHHLSPPQSIHLEHKIKLSGNCPAGTTCYDIAVDVPFHLEKEMTTFLANTEKCWEIDAYDGAISAAIKKIQDHYRRWSFFLGFSQSPVDFVNALIASQGRDLRLAAGDPTHNSGKECRSDFYNQPWVEDAVTQYLNRKTAAGSDAL